MTHGVLHDCLRWIVILSLARRPVHRPTADQVEMNVGNTLTGGRAAVVDHAVPPGHIESGREFLGDDQDLAAPERPPGLGPV